MGVRKTTTRITEQRDTVSETLASAVKALEHAVTALENTVKLLHTAIFGRWDEEENRMVPGMQGRIADLETSHKTVIERMDKRDKRDRMVILIGGVVAALLVARSLGVPTEDLGRFISALFSAFSAVVH